MKGFVAIVLAGGCLGIVLTLMAVTGGGPVLS